MRFAMPAPLARTPRRTNLGGQALSVGLFGLMVGSLTLSGFEIPVASAASPCPDGTTARTWNDSAGTGTFFSVAGCIDPDGLRHGLLTITGGFPVAICPHGSQPRFSGGDGRYDHGEPTGVWRIRRSDASLAIEVVYAGDLGTYIRRGWYGNGRLQRHDTYSGGKRNGASLRWYRKGALQSGGVYQDGYRTGVWTQYWDNGVRRSVGRWDRSKPDGLWSEWNRCGALVKRVTYVDGEEARIEVAAAGDPRSPASICDEAPDVERLIAYLEYMDAIRLRAEMRYVAGGGSAGGGITVGIAIDARGELLEVDLVDAPDPSDGALCLETLASVFPAEPPPASVAPHLSAPFRIRDACGVR